jgi:hypothetical protein
MRKESRGLKANAFLSVGMIYRNGRKIIGKRGRDSTNSSMNSGAASENWNNGSDVKLRKFPRVRDRR